MAEFPKIDILDDLLKTAERDFDAAVKHAAAIDDKAQKTSGLAGLFLAAAFGFVKPESLATLREQYGLVALGLLYLALSLLWSPWCFACALCGSKTFRQAGYRWNRRKCPCSSCSSLRMRTSTRK